MRMTFAAMTIVIVSIMPLRAVDRADAGSHTVQVVLGEWKDAARASRSVLWKCYLPRTADHKSPVVLYSPGGGGNRDSNEMLGRHLASHGIAVICLQHEGSDDRAMRGNPRALKAVNDPKASEPRFRDIHFVVKMLKDGQSLGELAGRLDARRIGISGHSYGGLTCQVIAGQQVNGFEQSLAIPELRGAFMLSPSPPRNEYGDDAKTFAKMLMPMFSVTGTADAPPDRSFAATDRRVPFDRTSYVDQWLLVLKGASHFTTSGQKERPAVARLMPGMDSDPNLDKNHAMIRAAALAFWQTVLNDDAIARAYLNGGTYAKELGQRGEFVTKPAKR
jgi:dienelactone hydrolase